MTTRHKIQKQIGFNHVKNWLTWAMNFLAISFLVLSLIWNININLYSQCHLLRA
jgi:hypothetical protein